MPFDGINELHEPHFARLAGFGRKLTTALLRSTIREPSTRDVVIALDRLAQKLDGGNKWTRGRYYRNGRYCLLGALQAIRCSRVARQMTVAYLSDAIEDFCGTPLTIVQFNDSRHSFTEVREVIGRAR